MPVEVSYREIPGVVFAECVVHAFPPALVLAKKVKSMAIDWIFPVSKPAARFNTVSARSDH